MDIVIINIDVLTFAGDLLVYIQNILSLETPLDIAECNRMADGLTYPLPDADLTDEYTQATKTYCIEVKDLK